MTTQGSEYGDVFRFIEEFAYAAGCVGLLLPLMAVLGKGISKEKITNLELCFNCSYIHAC